MAANDLVDDRQAEARARADFLRREERVANLAQVLLGNAAARVGDADRDVVGIVQLRLDDDLALRLDGLGRVRDDVEEHLVDLRRRALDLGKLAVELVDRRFVLDDVLRDDQRLVEAGVDVEARDRRAVEAAEVLQALRHLRQLAKSRDAVAREVLNFLDRGFELVVAEYDLHVAQGADELGLILGAIREVFRLDRERADAGRDEIAQRLEPFADELGVVGEIQERRVDLVTDAGDELAERRHLLRLHELHLRLFEVRERSAQLLGTGADALLERFVEHREVGVGGVDLAIAAVQAQRDETDGEQQHDRIDGEHQPRLLDARDGDRVHVLSRGARAPRRDRRRASRRAASACFR